MKTAIGKMYQRRIMAAMASDVRNASAIVADARLELMDLCDHSGPRALYRNTLRDLRELKQFAQDFGL